MAEREPSEHNVCPKCQQRHTVKATETWEKEIHFCVDCAQAFTVKKPLVTNVQEPNAK